MKRRAWSASGGLEGERRAISPRPADNGGGILGLRTSEVGSGKWDALLRPVAWRLSVVQWAWAFSGSGGGGLRRSAVGGGLGIGRQLPVMGFERPRAWIPSSGGCTGVKLAYLPWGWGWS
jgi:hypothetical protein